jgi:hypothetical protein
MRKCPDCGYLVFGDGDACKHCGAPLPAPVAAAVGVPPVLPPFTRDGAPASPPPVTREYWTPPDPVAPPPAASNKSPRALVAIICVVAMALGWVTIGNLLNKDSLPSGTSDFVSGHGVAYSSPDHTFDARFPKAPTVERRPLSTPTASVTINLAQVQTDDYELVAASMVLPVSVPSAQVDTVLHDILRAGAESQGATISSEEKVTHYGATGIEVHAQVRDGYPARLMVLISRNHVYLLGAHAKHGTERLYDALVSSLVMY